MELNRFMYKGSDIFFILFFIFAVFGFWPSYYSRVTSETDIHLHLHGIAMTIWCLMLISQAFLIRFKKYPIHRIIGKISFVVFPLILIITMHLVHVRFQGLVQFANIHLSTLALMVNSILLMGLFYGLAIFFRKKPMIHARFMMATIFPMFTPITDRIIYRRIPQILDYAPQIDGRPIAPSAGFLLVDIIIIILIFWDAWSHRNFIVFPVVLLGMVVFQATVLYTYDFMLWKDFCVWFVNL